MKIHHYYQYSLQHIKLKIEYLEHQVGKINVALKILFKEFGTWPDDETFKQYPYLLYGNNFVTADELNKQIVKNMNMQLAVKVERNIDNKKIKSKKNREKLKRAANALLAVTRRKKQPTEILQEPIKQGTLLTDARKRTIVKLKNEKPPNDIHNQVL